MPRITSLTKALVDLRDLGLVLTPETRLNRGGGVLDTRLWVYNPESVVAVARSLDPQRDDKLPEGHTIGMVIIFDDEGKFLGANYAHLYWDEGYASDDDERFPSSPAGWEVRCAAGAWLADERTLKAAVGFFKGFSPVGQAQARLAAQEATQAAEKAEKERAANLTALNQAVLDNRDARRWAGSVAEDAAYERRRVVSMLRDLAKAAESSADALEAGKRSGSVRIYPANVIDIAAHLAKLDALEATLTGPLAEAIKTMAERYDY